MPAMYDRISPGALGRLRLRLRPLLRQAGQQYTPRQAASGKDAGGDSAFYAGTWPNRDFGVRCPEPDETQLSWSEVRVALREGL